MSERRYYTLGEANAMVPWLEQCFARILQLRSQLRALYAKLEQLGQRPELENLLLGDEPMDGEVQSARAKFVGLMELMQEELATITAEGIEIKDLDTGLCDFFSVSIVPGKEVYLCWRYGEKRISYYHELDAGFVGRKPIPMPTPLSS